eukprot:2705268-Rhodomonas_salina.1
MWCDKWSLRLNRRRCDVVFIVLHSRAVPARCFKLLTVHIWGGKKVSLTWALEVQEFPGAELALIKAASLGEVESLKE